MDRLNRASETRLPFYPYGMIANFLLNHTDAASSVTLPGSYADALTGEPVGQALDLGPREVRILKSVEPLITSEPVTGAIGFLRLQASGVLFSKPFQPGDAAGQPAGPVAL
jgi:hypothetical protein